MALPKLLSGSRNGRRITATVLLAMATVASLCAVAPAANAAAITRIVKNGQQWQVFVNSPAMRRVIRFDVIVPVNQARPRPTLLLLDGNGATENMPHSGWITDGGAFRSLADKQINVVMPIGGGGSFYTDWQKDDPRLGHLKWETFLTQELPPLMDKALKGNGKWAVGGLSMGAHPAVLLAERHPGLYRSVASMSGCLFSDSASLSQFSVREVVKAVGGNPDNMWGPPFSGGWGAHDPSNFFSKLRGKPVYLYTGTGTPGPVDFATGSSSGSAAGTGSAETMAKATSLENITHDCTITGAAKMAVQGVLPVVDYNILGTHSWPYWRDALVKAWPTLRIGLGV